MVDPSATIAVIDVARLGRWPERGVARAKRRIEMESIPYFNAWRNFNLTAREIPVYFVA